MKPFSSRSIFKSEVRQNGIVSLLTTIIVSILLTIIATSAVGLSVNELRQGENADQSVKAYFAAEAGLEDAMYKVKSNIQRGIAANAGTQPNCAAPKLVDPSNPEVYYTCQTVNLSVNHLEGQLGVEQVNQVGPISGISNLILNWHLYGTDPDIVSGAYSYPGNYPSKASWTYPSAMEVTILSYDPSQAITPACPNTSVPGCSGSHGIKVATTLISPASSGSGTGSIVTPTSNGLCSAGNVITTQGYNCTINLSGFNSALVYFLRVRPRYSGGHYQLKFTNGVTTVSVPTQTAVIDVTARAGNVYRRVEAQIPIKTGAVSGLDYVLFSDTDICKDYTVNGNSVLPGLCAP